jgi:hypothetical protein
MGKTERGDQRLLATAAAAGLIAVVASVWLVLEIEESSLRCVGANSAENCGGISALALTAAGGFLVSLVALAIRWAAMVKARVSLGVVGRIAIASVLVAVVGAGILTFREGIVSDAIRAIWSPNTDSSLSDPSIASHRQDAIFEADREGVSPKFRHPFPEVPQSRKGLDLETDPFMAESVAEQEWLDRNGYPNAAQWAAYSTASDLQLEAAALAGDKTAAAMFAQRQFINGDETALERMLTAGANGNTFAIELLASTLVGVKKDRVSGYALSRVAEMRGNIRTGFVREAMFSPPLSPLERVEAENEAAEMYKRMLRLQRTLLGENSPPVDMRPIGG